MKVDLRTTAVTCSTVRFCEHAVYKTLRLRCMYGASQLKHQVTLLGCHFSTTHAEIDTAIRIHHRDSCAPAATPSSPPIGQAQQSPLKRLRVYIKPHPYNAAV